MESTINVNINALKATVSTLIQLKFNYLNIDDIITKSNEISDSLVTNIRMDFDLSDKINIVPINDLKHHETDSYCGCNPVFDDGIIIHNSFDGREKLEESKKDKRLEIRIPESELKASQETAKSLNMHHSEFVRLAIKEKVRGVENMVKLRNVTENNK